ncbi:mucoidy inhibitor MuiA family protein [Streptomyces sp. NPDC049040]|uniref:mucoidy inhibitor MuiA family protein n=1 Tax=Streptomyces sp. NPDC049040 TaxID=3365593 RepID=UPI003715663D
MDDAPRTPGTGPTRPEDAEAPDAPPELTALPITAVTCMEDRAQIERAGSVRLGAGVGRLRIGPVTPLTADRSLRADFAADSGARVVDARVVRTYTPTPPGEPGREASELRREVHQLEQELADAKLLRQRLDSALAVVGQARTDLHRDIVQGAGGGDADPERWADRLDRVEQEAEPRIGELHKLRRRLHDIEEELREARLALAVVETAPQQLTAHLDLVVEAERDGTAELRVTGLVPCALWRPAYRATLAADRASVRVETDAFVWQETGEDWTGVRLTLSTARPTLAASPPVLADDVLTLRDRSVEERRTVEVNLREEEIRTVGGTSPAAPAGLPGLHDGGDVRVLAAPHPVSVPSDHRPHRVHVTSFAAPCTVEDTCAPELSPLVVATARLTNTSGHVLLAGPVDLVRGSGFVGRGRLDFAGAGEEFEVAFGSEDTFRVVRHTEESRDTTGLAAINQRTVLTRRVRLFVSRLDARPGAPERRITVRERVPVSEVSAVEVDVRTADCRPAPDTLDDEGIARYELRLGPGEHREIELVYDITAAASVTGL